MAQRILQKANSFDTDPQFFRGGLKFVRWDYTPTANKPNNLEVHVGDEVELLEQRGKEWKVRFKNRQGYIPAHCFHPRITVKIRYEQEDDQEVSVYKDEVVGIIQGEVGEKGSFKLIRKKDGSEGMIPNFCFYNRQEVFAPHKRKRPEEISVEEGDFVGLVDNYVDSSQTFWNVYREGETGCVPSVCFERPAQVHWDFDAKKECDITVKKGDMVTLVDHNTDKEIKVRVRLGEKVGLIPKSCFYTPSKVYWDYDAENNSENDPELSVKKGDIVGIIESNEREKFVKARLDKKKGWVPKKCFEIPAKVIQAYKGTRPSELTVNVGQDVRVMDASASIQVRLGAQEGLIPFNCINTDAKDILPMLKDPKSSVYGDASSSTHQKTSVSLKGPNVDERALDLPLELSDSTVVMEYLKDLKPGQIIDIGQALGVSFETLNIKDVPEVMVKGWLSKKGTWRSLIVVLQNFNMNKIVERITKGNTRLESRYIMTQLEYSDENSKRKEIKISREACNKWREIGTIIGIEDQLLAGWAEEYPINNSNQFQRVVAKWIETGGKYYRATWIGLQRVLDHAELGALSEKIKSAMPFLSF